MLRRSSLGLIYTNALHLQAVPANAFVSAPSSPLGTPPSGLLAAARKNAAVTAAGGAAVAAVATTAAALLLALAA